MTNPLMDLIGSGEGDYNSYNRGTANGEHGKRRVVPANQKIDFSDMTIEDIRRRQALSPSDPDRFFAVGRYQFIPANLSEAIKKLRIDEASLFTPELQDRLFNEFLLPKKRWQVHNYIVGNDGASLHDAQKAICKEWASVEDPDTPGHVYAPYENGNKMHTTAAQVAIVLDEMRAEYTKNIDKGLSPTEAWAATTTMGPGQNANALRAHSVRASSGGVLRLGSHGPAVGELQDHLSRLGYTGAEGQALSADNHFGEDTRRAVEAFQRDHVLAADGVAGPATLAVVKYAVATELRSIGQPDATYLHTDHPNEALSAYRTLPQEPELTVPTLPVTGTSPQTQKADASHEVLFQRPDAEATRALQENLNTLGVTDLKDKALAIDGIYGVATRTAVARFQGGHGLPVTGQADEATRSMVEGQAFIADIRRLASPEASWKAPSWEAPQPSMPERDAPARATPRFFSESERASPNRSIGDPRRPDSPNHALYNELQRSIPDASEDRLLQFTAACHKNLITADNLCMVHLDEGKMTLNFRGSDALATPAQVDLKTAPPTAHEAIEQMQQFDERELQLSQAFQMQNAQRSQGAQSR